MSGDLKQYYSQRAIEYENIYQKSERQKDLKKIKELICKVFDGRDVLEIACGTGYWTQFIARSAKSIIATDCSSEVIKIAENKDYRDCSVSFIKDDAYSPKNIRCGFNGGFCGFWLSHVPKKRISEFLEVFHSKLEGNSLVVMIDNRYVETSSTPISRTDSNGNTYQIRKLQDGTEYEVLKNFPDERKLRAILSPYSNTIDFISFDYYWLIQYHVINNL